MTAPTLDRVLRDAGQLRPDERDILEDLLRKRRIEAWRTEAATEAKKDAAAFRKGRLKAQSVEDVITRLRDTK